MIGADGKGQGRTGYDIVRLRTHLREVVSEVGFAGMPHPTLEGKLLRPLVSLAGTGQGERGTRGGRFWAGALAVQMVHEASLHHDDIVDQAGQRRGRPSLAARAGSAAALIAGDHLLTAAYRMALETRSGAFFTIFVEAVERTVAGERSQGSRSGEWLSEAEYREIVALKSGELFGCALALGPALHGANPARTASALALGRRVGSLYQMVDDFLDYCPRTDAGKPPLQDYRHGKWTFPLLRSNVASFDYLPRTVPELLFTTDGPGESAMRMAFRTLRTEAGSVADAVAHHMPEDVVLRRLLVEWVDRAKEALAREEEVYGRKRIGATGRRTPSPLFEEARALGSVGEQATHLRKHGKSFRFASLLLPPPARRIVGEIYTFCRFTDDLVDEHDYPTAAAGHASLDEWLALCHRAHAGERTGIVFLDDLMRRTAARGVSVVYAEALIAAVRMDLVPVRFDSMTDLRVYTHGVASVVGQWMTELFATPSRATLERAAALGHAMQITNIVRDVGEDWRMGRLYLPLDRMRAAGVSPEALARMVDGDEGTRAALREEWRVLMEEMMSEAEASYASGFAGIPTLPPFLQRPVAVAAHVYRGIHREVRRNAYDNLGRRAFTTLPRKVVLGAGGLLELRSARRALGSGSRRALSGPERRREARA